MSDVPVREAIILPAASDPLRPVARVPLLVRTLLALQAGGIERCTLVGGLPMPRDSRIRVRLDSAPRLCPADDDELRLVVGADVLLDRTLVEELQARARRGEVMELAADGARVRVTPGRLVATGGTAGAPAGAGVLRPAAEPDGAAALLRGLANPRDGYLDRLVHRRISRRLTVRLLPTSLSPNLLTLVGIALGVAGGLLAGVPGPMALAAAVLLLEASAVIDCSDGELARLCHAESRLGHWLDICGDTLVSLALLGGIAMRLAASGGVPGWPVLAVLALGVLGAFAVITWCEESEERRRRVPSWENRVLDRVLSPLTTRDWYVFPVAFAIAGRLDLLVPGAAVGAHAFWLVALALLLRALGRARPRFDTPQPPVDHSVWGGS